MDTMVENGIEGGWFGDDRWFSYLERVITTEYSMSKRQAPAPALFLSS